MDVTYVSFVTNKIFIKNVQPELIQSIIDLGGRELDESTDYVLEFTGENEKIRLFTVLRDMGVAFSGGRDWSPSEQFEDLRDKGLITGKYKHIVWWGPGKYHVNER